MLHIYLENLIFAWNFTFFLISLCKIFIFNLLSVECWCLVLLVRIFLKHTISTKKSSFRNTNRPRTAWFYRIYKFFAQVTFAKNAQNYFWHFALQIFSCIKFPGLWRFWIWDAVIRVRVDFGVRQVQKYNRTRNFPLQKIHKQKFNFSPKQSINKIKNINKQYQ